MVTQKQHVVLARPGFAEILAVEFEDRWGFVGQQVSAAAVAFDESATLPAYGESVFARQYLPHAALVETADLSQAVGQVMKRLEVMAKRANRQTGRWTLHAFALDDDPATARAAQLEKALLAQIKAKLPVLFKRYCAPDELIKLDLADAFLIQIYVPSLSTLWFSTASIASGVSPFIGGNQRMRHRAGSPSRSSNKLEEAFVCLGRHPATGESAVDLGAAPGGWTFTLASYGADVTAVDHAELTLPPGKKLAGRVTHLRDNGLKYLAPAPVDWMCCDMVIGSREALGVLAHWFEQGRMRHFVVNIKLPQAKPWPAIKEALALLTTQAWPVTSAKHLYHDRQEITLMGSREPRPVASDGTASRGGR